MSRTDLPSEPDFSLHPDPDDARAAADCLFDQVQKQLRAALPASADIRHIGATAVASCLTKGDLDVVVRVTADTFAQADGILAAKFDRNVGSKRTDSFSSFQDADASPHLGIQLTTIGGEDDCFHLFADALKRDPQLVDEYNTLKRRFDGHPMNVYRAAKGDFVSKVLSRIVR